MRITLVLAASLVLLSFPSSAQTTQGEDVYVVPGSSLSFVAMAAWQAGSRVESVAGSGAASAPGNAVKYLAKEVYWPTARVRVMTFDDATGGVLHPITDETLLYV